MLNDHDTIVAPATPTGGAIAIVRISGSEAIAVAERLFRGRSPLSEAAGRTVHYGSIRDGERLVDEVLVTLFRAPHSYTGEDSVEISCHGSAYIVSEILRLALGAGARMASPGEFTLRAFLAGKLDLAQAEAVADLIASSSRAAHAMATNQMRGGYSEELEGLRDKLVHLTSLLELELDFSEEDVEFADRQALRRTMEQIGREIDRLRSSFSLGNAIKEGVAVAIVGAPNVGKSTLLNRLLNEERAMVSEIAGTTRDVIEERANIGGVLFRFLDTAGIRTTGDRLERMGIERTMESIRRAQVIIRLVDARRMDEAMPEFEVRPEQRVLTVVNKMDAAPEGFRVRGTAEHGGHRRVVPRGCGRIEQPPLRGADGGPQIAGARTGGNGRGAPGRPAERGNPAGNPPSGRNYGSNHHGRNPRQHLLEILHRQVTACCIEIYTFS